MTVKKVKKKATKKKAGVRARKMPNGKGNSTIVRGADGVPKAEPPKNKNLLGKTEPPDTEGKHHLEKEKSLQQVEILLLKGIISPNQIAASLGIAYVTAKRYVEQVHYRWSATGDSDRLRQVKGEAKARLDLLTNELWAIHSNSDDDGMKLSSLSQLLGVHDRRMQLDGLTPQAINLINTTVNFGGGAGPTVEERIQSHQESVGLVDALLAYVKETSDSGVVDGEFTEVD